MFKRLIASIKKVFSLPKHKPVYIAKQIIDVLFLCAALYLKIMDPFVELCGVSRATDSLICLFILLIPYLLVHILIYCIDSHYAKITS